MEIRFRGKDYLGNWKNGNLLKIEDTFYIIGENDMYKDGHHICQSSDHPLWVDENYIGQFTGLKDKNGVEIYDGDFISLTSSSGEIIIHQVHISEKGLSTELRNIERTDPWNQFSHIRNEWWEDFKNDISVIGNKYDNPELIKK